MTVVSVKGVIRNLSGAVLLARNDRQEWELPGGRQEANESQEKCLVREVMEETGLTVTVGPLLGTWPFEVLPSRWVDIVAYGARITGGSAPRLSQEHDAVAFWPPAALSTLALPAVYRDAIALWP